MSKARDGGRSYKAMSSKSENSEKSVKSVGRWTEGMTGLVTESQQGGPRFNEYLYECE